MSAAVNAHLIEVILALVVCEAAGLFWLRRHKGLGPPLATILPTLLAGAFLLLALREALADGAMPTIALWLAAALLAHLFDLYGRWPK